MTKAEAIQEFRLLIHWGCEVFMDEKELELTLDHTDDLTHDQVFDMIVADLRARGETFEMPSDPLTDQKFIGLMTRVYDPGKPAQFPPEPEELAARKLRLPDDAGIDPAGRRGRAAVSVRHGSRLPCVQPGLRTRRGRRGCSGRRSRARTAPP